MKLKLIQICDRGIPNKERLWIKVVAPTYLDYYIVFDSSYSSPIAISTVPKYSFWFPHISVYPGDNIVLQTGSGIYSSKKDDISGTTTHCFYWGLGSVIWQDKNSCAVLIEINNWETTSYTQ